MPFALHEVGQPWEGARRENTKGNRAARARDHRGFVARRMLVFGPQRHLRRIGLPAHVPFAGWRSASGPVRTAAGVFVTSAGARQPVRRDEALRSAGDRRPSKRSVRRRRIRRREALRREGRWNDRRHGRISSRARRRVTRRERHGRRVDGRLRSTGYVFGEQHDHRLPDRRRHRVQRVEWELRFDQQVRRHRRARARRRSHPASHDRLEGRRLRRRDATSTDHPHGEHAQRRAVGLRRAMAGAPRSGASTSCSTPSSATST